MYAGSSYDEKWGYSMVTVISVSAGGPYDHPPSTESYQIQIEASRDHDSQQ